MKRSRADTVGEESQLSALQPSEPSRGSEDSHLRMRLRSDSSPPGRFSAVVEIAGLVFEVEREGKHANLHVRDTPLDPTLRELGLWVHEDLDRVIPKLEFLLGAARVANGD